MIAPQRRHLVNSLVSMSFSESILIINNQPISLPHSEIRASKINWKEFQSTYLQDELKMRVFERLLRKLKTVSQLSLTSYWNKSDEHKHATQQASIRQNK